MKKIMLVTGHKFFAQSLANIMKTHSDLCSELHLTYDIKQAALDAEVLKADMVIIDISAATDALFGEVISLCGNLRKAAPDCRIILLIPGSDSECRKVAINAVQDSTIDDFIYHDASLDYLFAKIQSI